MDKILHLQSHAKINLGLDVLSKRNDGYHNVRMIMQTIDLADSLTMEKTKEDGIFLHTDMANLPADKNNLVYQAVERMKNTFHLKEGILIELKKSIPMAAGMAGGSADAAAALRGMNQLFDLNLSQKELRVHGKALGADVPFCIAGGTALSEGIGERLTALSPMPRCFVLIAKPSLSVSTRYVYENLDLTALRERPDINGMIASLNAQDLSGIAKKISNVLESVTVKKYPIIDDIKKEMVSVGALNALMSGSGPTVFGLFYERPQMEAAGKLLAEAFPSLQIIHSSICGGMANE